MRPASGRGPKGRDAMKKWTAVLLAALFVLTAAGCSGSATTLPGVYDADGHTVKPTAPPTMPASAPA